MAKISLIVPVYNVEKYVSNCIKSIQAQTFQDYEVIIVNDGSQDNSISIVNDIITKDQRFNILNKVNGGLSSARNAGMLVAKGDYIVFIDSDDELCVDALEKLYYGVINSDADILISSIKRNYIRNKSIMEYLYNYDSYHQMYSSKVFDDPSIYSFITNSACAKIFRRDFLVNNNINFAQGLYYEDLEFTAKYLSYNPNISTINYYTYIYNMRSDSMIGNSSRFSDIIKVFDLINQHYTKLEINMMLHEELSFMWIKHAIIGTSFRVFNNYDDNSKLIIKRIWQDSDSYKINHNKYINKLSFIETIYIGLINMIKKCTK